MNVDENAKRTTYERERGGRERWKRVQRKP